MRVSAPNWLEEARPRLSLERVEQLSPEILRIDEEDTLARLLDLGWLYWLRDEAKERLEGQLTTWLVADDPAIARHGALLLAEMGTITSQSLPKLCESLEDTSDLSRYRAQQAINTKHLASHLRRETIEGIAELYSSSARQRAHSISATSLSLSLKEIEHDRADWLQTWAEVGQTIILGHVHRLSAEAWAVWLELLTTASPAVQKALLDSTSWLLRLSSYAVDDEQYDKNRLTNEQISQLVPVLMGLREATDETVRLAAISTLGYLSYPDSEVVRQLLTLLPQEEGLHETLARLAARNNSLPDEVRVALVNALPDEKAAAALVRLAVTETQANTTLRKQLRQWLPDDEDLLPALLAAGTDDDGWDEYHKRLVIVACDVVQRSHDELLGSLLNQLEEALDEGEWPAIRIRLATVAACAKVMGDALNSTREATELEDLLVRGTNDPSSHNSRRFAITALSHLHLATPVVMEALLEAARDISIVQQDAIKAAGNFQRLSQAFDNDQALAPLIEALTGESQATAYLAGLLLAALGRSPAVLGSEALRQRIAGILSEALRHPNAKRDVYVLEHGSIEPKGTLALTLYDALAQVVALPE